eukprot:Sdes_comp20657_c0_seq2m15959
MLSGGFRGGSMMTSPRKANSGGGFMVGNFDSPATESERKKIGGSQTISPVTIRQLLNASQNSMDDTFRVDGKTPAQVRLLFAASTLFNLSLCQDSPLNPHFCWFLKVTFVGAIRSVVEQSTHLIYKVEDGTGEIDVRMWLDSHDSEHKAQQRSAFQEGIYVRVVGQMRTFMDKLSINSYSIRPIADMNEISFHMIEVIYVHLYNTKGALHSHKMGSQTPSDANKLSSHGNFDGVSGRVHLLVQNYQSDIGISMMELKNQLQGVSENKIREAIDFLAGEGHIYSTIDDDHFKATDA